MILLSPVARAFLVGAGFEALRAGLVLFWMPPTGAVVGRPEERRTERRRRWVERISSRDWLSLLDMVADM